MALRQKIVALVGGVGGAKLALGLATLQPAPDLTFIVNTGDDFWHLGLKVCPDVDTLVYTLSGLVDARMGWGVANDTTHVLDSLAATYRIEPWFKLGDKDLGMHLLRTQAIRKGTRLTDFTAEISEGLGIAASILPMCDADMPTIVDTSEFGELNFQEYFVKHGWQPKLRQLRYTLDKEAQLSPEAETALKEADMVLIAPSNPWLSIAPILAVPGMRAALAQLQAPIVAFTPIVGGDAVKGPTAKIMRELRLEVSARTVADFYSGIIDGFVNDLRNPPLQIDGLRATRLDTLMTDAESKTRLARQALDWIQGWR